MERDEEGGVERVDGEPIPYTELPDHLKGKTLEKTLYGRHPSSNPRFDAKREHEVWYLAHPLAGDDRFTFEQNMNHVIKLMRICYEEGWYVIAPYHTICLALDDESDEWRRIGLEVDCNVVRAFGRVLLTGHKCSSGMCHERDTCLDFQYGGIVHNFVGYNDDEFRMALRALKNGGFIERDVPKEM